MGHAKRADKQEPKGELLTVAEVARAFRMDATTIRKLIQAGQIEAIRLPGGGIRIRKSVVDAILNTPPNQHQ